MKTHAPPAFRILALPRAPFEPLFELDDGGLARHAARRVTVDAKPGYPCRLSLEDAEPGERVILLPFAHHDVASPYRASGPIFVREHAAQAAPGAGEVPEMLRRRLLSVRAYDGDGTLIGAEVSEGAVLEGCIERLFAAPRAAQLHLHAAKFGCYLCRVLRN